MPTPKSFSSMDNWVFDLDDTLYPRHLGVFSQIDRRIDEFLATYFDEKVNGVRARRRYFLTTHGTTMNGLIREHDVDPHAFLDYVHDIDLSPLSESPSLRTALQRLPGRKFIYTNGSARHAESVLSRLGLADCFDGIHDIIASAFRPKPMAEPFDELLGLHGIEPRSTVMVEDMARNLKPAHERGMTTVLVRTDNPRGAAGAAEEHVHYVIDDVSVWLEEITA